MTTVTTETLSAGDAAGALYRAFGAIREWSDFLTDCRRGRATFYGLRLLPLCRFHDGKTYRPVYSYSAVRAFIEAVIAKKPNLVGASKLKPILVDFDTADTRHWRHIKIKPIACATSFVRPIHRPGFAATGSIHLNAAIKGKTV